MLPFDPASATPRQAAFKKQVPRVIKERTNAMEILTNIIFLLNMLKTLINHFF